MSNSPPRWPLTAIVLLAFAAPFNVRVVATRLSEEPLHVLTASALVVTVVLTIRRWHARDVLPIDWIDWLTAGWFVGVWIAALAGDDVVVGAAAAARLSVAILLIPAVRGVVKSEQDAKAVVRGLIAGTICAALFGLGMWLWGTEAQSARVFAGQVTKLGPLNRLTRPWAHANVAAMSIGATIAGVAFIRPRLGQVVSLLVLVPAMVLTISRGGVIALGAAALTWIVVRRTRTETLALIGAAVLAAVVFSLSSAWETRVEQLGEQAFYASTISAPTDIEVGKDGTLVQVTLTNLSSTTWLRSGQDRVLISARWLGSDGNIWVEDWWQLPRDLEPGGELTADLAIAPRAPNGQYDVRWDLIIVDRAYFGQFLGEPAVVSAAEVTGSVATVAEAQPYELVPRRVNVARGTMWRTAWNVFTDSPIVGVGPNQFGVVATARSSDTGFVAGGHAHNVVLEPLATWGLLGALPFFALFAASWLGSLGRAWRSKSTLPAVVGVSLTAVAVHGLVDWPLVVISTGIPIGILLGLANSGAMEAEATL